jgi:hypothetical protein
MLNFKKLLAYVGLAATVGVIAPLASAQASATGPTIKARPHKVMVSATTTLKGKGFPANSTIQLRECGKTFWLAPAEPCLTENATTVSTDAKGRFQTSFTVGLCPEGEPTKKPTQRVCYVGELITGEDTGSLLGAARLIVTYP